MGTTEVCDRPSFRVTPRDLNSGHDACIASTLPTELFMHLPKDLFLTRLPPWLHPVKSVSSLKSMGALL